ncbi:EF_hand domain-containing protein [Hexamita inflata]|uniref:EF hand domain-containing protein n=1 Tax=Hexamita inflata TaxID=28002 RepID=A0AA86TVS0_9EUKA|nr:EF hand domain-containing protein [Hexamita inflata]CAI9948768.1 EF hand domain-containing protein [Hexamita inflata]
MGCTTDLPQPPEQAIVIDQYNIKHCSEQYIKDFFAAADNDKNGTVDIHELVVALNFLGIDADTADIAAVILTADVDNNGNLDYDEFRQFIYCFMNGKTHSLVQTLFFICDSNQSGTIERDELFAIFRKMGLDVDQKKTEQLLEMFGDGISLTYNQYIQMFEKLEK